METPEIDGLETLRQQGPLPVVFSTSTSTSTSDLETELRALGARAGLAKPFDPLTNGDQVALA